MLKRRAGWKALLTSFLICFAWFGDASGAPRVASKAVADRAKEVAQKVYAQGVDHYRAGRLLEALAAFRASYEMVPSPNSHLMIARALRDRGELVESYLEYGRLVVEADAAAELDTKYNSASFASRAERASVRARLTMVTVTMREPPEGVRVVVGDRAIERESWSTPTPIVSGAVVARASAAGVPEQRQELVAVPGGDLVVSFDFAASPALPSTAGAPGGQAPLRAEKETSPFPSNDAIPDIPRQPPRPPRPPPDRKWAYVSLGVGAAGLATFATFGAISQSIFNSLQADCPGGHCPPGRADEVDRGRRAQTIANVGFGVTIVGAALGSILLVNAAADERKTEETARRSGRVAVTDLSVGLQSVAVGGVF